MLMIPAATFGASLYIGLTSLDSSGLLVYVLLRYYYTLKFYAYGYILLRCTQ